MEQPHSEHFKKLPSRPTPPHIKDKVMSFRKEGLSIRAISDELDSVSKSTIQRILKEEEILTQIGHNINKFLGLL